MTQEIKKTKKKSTQKENVIQEESKAEKPTKPAELKYGPPVSFPYQRVWSRCILILGVLLIVWYNSRQAKEVSLAKQKDVLVSRTQNVDCSVDYRDELEKYPGCVPEKCGRVVTDKLVSTTEVDVLLKLAKGGLDLAGSDGGASILDLHSGALSKGEGFINIYKQPAAKKLFNNMDLAIYRYGS
ncbi:pkhd domain-containing transmembrane protein [Lasius niger]|uniref:Pkhd domain-containing transmembrane protein n=1 Tax=Lasius niger TaxID=67767 RepID=A0A0J7JZM9_LASNI|nr:pkhd domain-containing transmembrane protein [Lasius niger]